MDKLYWGAVAIFAIGWYIEQRMYVDGYTRRKRDLYKPIDYLGLSPFLCAPTMSTGMKLSRFSARFCGATPPRIARKSPICLPPINSAQHPQQIRIAKAFFPAQPIWYYCNGLLLAIHKVLLHAGGFNV